MKRILTIVAIVLSSVSSQATVTINLGAGTLYNANGTTPQATGMLIQLLASTTDGVFTAPRAGSYTGGSLDDVVLFSFSVNGGLGSAGSFLDALNINLANYANLTAGDPLLLRWYPTTAGPLSPSATLPAGPAAGAAFGQFRTDIVEVNNFSNFAWLLPADGATIDLNFLTQMVNPTSTHPEADGVANMLVAVPEPSTYALLAVGLFGVGYAARRKRLAA